MDIGKLYLGRDVNGENINEAMVAEGLVDVRRVKNNDEEARFASLEETAKSAGKGKHSSEPSENHIRDLKWTVDNPTKFVDSFRGKPVNAIIEYIKDGSTFRALLLPSMHLITFQLSGLRCPTFKKVEDKDVAEPFADEAKFYVESRLLQRDVKIILEGVANPVNGILLGTILHPNGNISEFLLRDGLARCVDWSMGCVTQGAEKYRAAEKQAKQSKLRLWKSYVPSNVLSDDNKRTIIGKVVEILNGDGMVIKTHDGHSKVYLSSVRPPRLADYKETLANKVDKKNVPLYDVPLLFEAREFLRKKLIGKKVNALVDYIQPKSEEYQEKTYCTIIFGETNVAEALISQGLAKVVRHKQDDEQRSQKYDELLAAEARAAKKKIGMHSEQEQATMKIADATTDSAKAKQFLPLLQRLGRFDALVEFAASGSRFRLYIQKETLLITFLLSGIECPRASRSNPQGNNQIPGEEFGDDALVFSKDRCMHREVKVEVETMDKGGNFIGYMFLDDGTNLSVGLVEQGYASVHSTAQRSSYYGALSKAEENAKAKRLNRWKNYVEEKKVQEEVEKNEPQERAVNYKRIVLTEVTRDLHFYAQSVENGTKLEQLTYQLRSELELRPPVAGAYTPKVGEVCVAKFSQDNEWYRARVLKVDGSKVTVLFIDYGNQESTVATKLAQIPAGFATLPGQAQEYALALVSLPKDDDYIEAAIDYFKSQILNDAEFLINTEYKNGSTDCVTLYNADKEDIGKMLIKDGFVLVERRRERKLQKLLSEYMKAQETAKSSRINLWRYGDITEDDATEFGALK